MVMYFVIFWISFAKWIWVSSYFEFTSQNGYIVRHILNWVSPFYKFSAIFQIHSNKWLNIELSIKLRMETTLCRKRKVCLETRLLAENDFTTLESPRALRWIYPGVRSSTSRVQVRCADHACFARASPHSTKVPWSTLDTRRLQIWHYCLLQKNRVRVKDCTKHCDTVSNP